MRECLDEGMLQCYFDGELPIDKMESATVHLASCVTCASLARELEQETALLTTALAAEFEAPVPSEQLRRRIDLAVENVNAPVVVEKRSFFGSFTGFLNFAPQQAFGYAGLIAVLAFAAIFGVMKMRGDNQPPVADTPQVAIVEQSPAPPLSATPSPGIKVVTPDEETPRPQPVSHKSTKTSATVAARKPAPVKLLPGERTYLQTIARLDSAIRADKDIMRPALQVEYQRNLAVVDRAIAATRTAAKNNPNNPDAADFMFAAYQSKVDLLNTIADARVGGRSH